MTVKFDQKNVVTTVFIILLMIGGAFLFWNYLQKEEVIDSGDEPIGAYAGNVNFVITISDSLAGGAHSPGTQTYYYNSVPPTTLSGIVMTAAGHVIRVDKEQNGIAYITLKVGTDEYLDYQTFKATNPSVLSSTWMDMDGDDKDELLIKVDVSDLSATGQNPTYNLNVPMIDEDVASWTDNDPSDKTGIGETSGTLNTIKWEFTGLDAGDGGVIGRIYFTTNVSREGDDIRLHALTLSGPWVIQGRTSWGNPIRTGNGNYEAYYFYPDIYTDPSDGILVMRPTGKTDRLDVELSYKSYFETNDQIIITLYMDIIAGDGAVTTLSDAVTVAEA